MQDQEIDEVAKILAEWNPLGEDSVLVKDLNGYKTEAIDIIFALQLDPRKGKVESIVMQVINEAFDLELTRRECTQAAHKIVKCLSSDFLR